MMNKNFLARLISFLIVASLVLAACQQAFPEPTQAPAQPQATEAQEPMATEEQMAPEDPYADVDPSGQTVTFWHQHSQDREEGLLEIVNDFNANNEWGITVDAEYQGSYGDIFNKMLGVLNTPDAPSLVVAYQNQAATYQLADALIDMNPLVNSEKWGLSDADKQDFFQGFFQQDVFPTYGNARLGFPPNRSMEVMYYNKDWLTELGYDAPPSTPEEFKEMACKAVEQPFSGAVAEGSMGYELSVDASRFASWTFAFGGDVFDYNTSQYTYDSPAAIEAMNYIQDLFNSGCATIVVESYGDQTDFGTGKLLFTVGSSSGLPFYDQAVSEGAVFDWSVAPIPHTTDEPVQNIYGASISIPKTTPEEQLAAWLFLKYYTSPEIQAKWAKISNYFPVRASVADGLSDYFASNPAYQTAFDMLKYGKFEPPVPGYDFVRDIAEEAMAGIANGDDVQSTLVSMNEEANQILSEQLTSPLPTPVPTDTPEPTMEPIGTEQNPIVWAFVPSGEMQDVAAGAQDLADLIYNETGLVIDTFVATEYAGVIEAMCSDPPKAQMGSLATFAYILAADRGCAEAEMVSVRFGSPTYNGQIFARADSGIESVEDLAGTTFCAVDPLSTSGWIIPSIEIKAAGLDPETDLDVQFAGSHDAAVAGVYNGDCDAGASYVDARTAIEDDYPDVNDVVKVISVSTDIPNDGVQYVPSFPQDLRDQIDDALLKIADTEEGQAALDTAYEWETLEKHDDSFYDPFRQLLDAAGVSVEELQ
jgi:phosphate/phosphite/phosphonate ABC transporter binding protein